MNILVEVFAWTYFHFPGINVQSTITELFGKCMLSFLKRLLNYFPEWLDHFTFPPAML